MRLTRFLLVALVYATACGSDDGGGVLVNAPFTGTYTLETVNGQPLPFDIANAGTTSIAITADTLTIAEGGTWSESGTWRTTAGGQVTTQTKTYNGTWIRNGNLLNLETADSSATRFTGTFTGTQLNFSDFSYPYVFTR